MKGVLSSERALDWRLVAANLGLAILYYISAKVGLQFAYLPGMATLVWFPTGLSLAAVLLGGYPLLIGVATGALLTIRDSGLPWWAVITASGGNTLEAFLGAFLLMRVARFDNSLQRLHDVTALLVWAALLSTMPSATFGVGSLYAAGKISGAEFPKVWLIWWLGNAVSALLVSPLILVWRRLPRWNWLQMGEFAFMVAATGIAALVAFGAVSTPNQPVPYPLVFLVSPFLVWAATRFEQYDATIANFTASAIAAWMTISDRGPFAPFEFQVSIALLWLFMAVNIVPALFLASSISQQRHTEESLQEAYAQTYQIINNTPGIAIQGYDQDGRVVFWNKASEELYGFTQEQVMGKRLGEFLLSAEDAQQFHHLLQQVVTTGQPAPLQEWKVTTASGETRYAISSLFPVELGRGQVRGICMDVDITERKHLEMRLLHAQRLESIGRIAGGIAHDFNNLLTAISGYTDLARSELPEDHPAQRELQRAQAVIERATQLVHHLLAFAKRQTLQPRPTDFSQLLQQMQPILRQATGRQVQIRLEFSPDLKQVLADPVQMEQVILNLVLNARDAMPQGGVITIEAVNVRVTEPLADAPDVPPGEYVRLSVIDTGEGIAPEHMDRLFEPFFTTKGERGTGLGLAVVYGVVKQSNGFIVVKSNPGEGTAFHIYLPAIG